MLSFPIESLISSEKCVIIYIEMVLDIYIDTAFIMKETNRDCEFSICGAELENGTGLCVNYFKRRDLYEKRIIFFNFKWSKWFEIYKSVALRFIFLTHVKKYVLVRVAFGPNRPFHKKLSLGTAFPGQWRANKLQTFVEGRASWSELSSGLNLWR